MFTPKMTIRGPIQYIPKGINLFWWRKNQSTEQGNGRSMNITRSNWACVVSLMASEAWRSSVTECSLSLHLHYLTSLHPKNLSNPKGVPTVLSITSSGITGSNSVRMYTQENHGNHITLKIMTLSSSSKEVFRWWWRCSMPEKMA